MRRGRTAEGEPEEETAAASLAPQAAESANSAGGQSPTCACGHEMYTCIYIFAMLS